MPAVTEHLDDSIPESALQEEAVIAVAREAAFARDLYPFSAEQLAFLRFQSGLFEEITADLTEWSRVGRGDWVSALSNAIAHFPASESFADAWRQYREYILFRMARTREQQIEMLVRLDEYLSAQLEQCSVDVMGVA